MDADERAVYYYVKSLRPKAASVREISRRAGSKRRYRYHPDWAGTLLLGMVERGILETESEDCYRLKPVPRQQTEGKRWVTPEIAQILKASGQSLDGFVVPEDEDEYYDRL